MGVAYQSLEVRNNESIQGTRKRNMVRAIALLMVNREGPHDNANQRYRDKGSLLLHCMGQAAILWLTYKSINLHGPRSYPIRHDRLYFGAI